MIKIHCIVCTKHKKFKIPKISCIFNKTLRLSYVYNKCAHEYKKIFKEEESLKKLKH